MYLLLTKLYNLMLQLHDLVSEFLIIEERKDLLTQVGINLEVFGDSGYVIKQLPLWMQNIDEQLFIEDLVLLPQ